ncbi:hypothetical protein KVR01_008760 [Diaporthe batatas]|uniref:uncharacterized protein n=1 Tax=Diaporthe batatas TaxID=748121 RepID=UPI001D051706|nr:uncharacterized protein KVR01_008760 [Diaporthe batatas]KAG8161773.1 hypothetical protein KVR01_008760 [Diaporthe batatas]
MEKTKLVYQLDTPYSSSPWPEISQQDQDAILDLLCSLLSPICQYRDAHIHPSKGKKAKAQKRKHDQSGEHHTQPPVPPPPAVVDSLDVGLTNITRHLAACSSKAEDGQGRDGVKDPAPTYSVVFVVRSATPSTFSSHLPQMVAAASGQMDEPICLVGFSKSCEERLSTCLGIPRVSSVALRAGESGQLKALVEFVRKRVAPVEARWMEDASKGQFRKTKINSIQAPVGAKRQKKG